MEKIILATIVGILALNLVLSILIPVTLMVINYIFRSEFNIGCYHTLKVEFLPLYKNGDIEIDTFLLDVAIPLLFVGVLAFIQEEAPTLMSFLLLLIPIAASLPLLRWLVDVSRNLRIKKESGDSTKLASMQKEIEELKKVIKDNNHV